MKYANGEMGKTARIWTGRAARVIAAGAFAFSMCGAATLQGTSSADADTTPGKVTINLPAESQKAGHTTNANKADKVRYNAYKVFTGNVGLDTAKSGSKRVGKNRISDVAWASEAMHKAVVGAIKGWDKTYADPADASESALKAAEFVANHIGPNGEPDEGNPSQDATLKLESSQFGSTLVAAIRASKDISVTNAKDSTRDLVPGKTYKFDDGWYLFVTSDQSVDGTDDSRAGTSPIFAVVGGDDVVVTEKDSVPTVDKQVKDDSRTTDQDGDWGMAADSNAGQDVKYRLVGTVANNIHSYDSYYYKFTDTLSGGLVFNVKTGQGHANGTAEVYLHKAHLANDKSAALNDHSYNVTSNFKFTVSEGKKKMEVEAQNLRSLAVNGSANPSYAMVAGDYLTVEYTARFAPDGSSSSKAQGTSHGTNVAQGATGNRNEAKITYSNNPKTKAKGSSIGQDTRVYTYSLRLHKQDKQNAARALKGAKFTLECTKGDDASSSGKYVQADGSLAAEPYKFTTDENGNILVKNLDEGTYELVETDAPPAEQASGNPDDAYELLDPATIVISSNVHSDTNAAGAKYANPNIFKKETAGQVLEMSSKVTGTSGFGHSSLIVAADSVDAAGVASGDGVHVTPTSGATSGVAGADGNVSVVVRETKETRMPLTGGAGIAAFAVTGGLVIALGAAMLTRRRQRAAGPDEG